MTTISDVSELVLYGTADAAFWQARLRPHELIPRLHDHRAEIMIGIFQARWNRIPFSELIIAASCEGLSKGRSAEGYFLLHAFNSSWFFSMVERHHFRTPYETGSFTKGESTPRTIEIHDDRQLLLRLCARRTPEESPIVESWQRPVWFAHPGNRSVRLSLSALVSSHRTRSQVDPALDLIEFGNATNHPILSSLSESNFMPLQWRMGQRAIHARTRTRRERVCGSLPSFESHPADLAQTAQEPVVDLFC